MLPTPCHQAHSCRQSCPSSRLKVYKGSNFSRPFLKLHIVPAPVNQLKTVQYTKCILIKSQTIEHRSWSWLKKKDLNIHTMLIKALTFMSGQKQNVRMLDEFSLEGPLSHCSMRHFNETKRKRKIWHLLCTTEVPTRRHHQPCTNRACDRINRAYHLLMTPCLFLESNVRPC